MKHVYESEKAAQKDIRVAIGYSAHEKHLSEAEKMVLEEAKSRLSMLSGRDLLSVVLKFHRNGLSQTNPARY